MNPYPWLRRHRRFVLFLALAASAAGVLTGLNLPVALFPQVQFPRLVVSIEAGDRPAEQMEQQVTRPLEQVLRGVPKVLGLRSTTSRGSAEVSVNFSWGTDMVSATLQAESALNQALPTLPAGTQFLVRRMDPTIFPMLAFSLRSDARDLVSLRDLATYRLLPLLSAVNGVAEVSILGGELAEYRIEVDPARLDAYGLALADVAQAVSGANVLRAVGRLEDRHRLFLIVADARLATLAAIRHTVLRSGADGLVELEDVAEVRRDSVPQWLRVTADGNDAVLVQVRQQRDANAVQIARDIRQQLAAAKNLLPEDVQLGTWYDQTELVSAAAVSVRDAILLGVLLSAAVLWLFLRRLRITLVAVLTVPAVLAASMLLLQGLGMSLNIMTLGGMAAAVGLIIDDMIVMLEQIVRRLGAAEAKAGIAERCLLAAREFLVPLSGSSAATIVVFVPLAFLGGVSGGFFKALSLTVAVALLISYLTALLVVPLLASHLLHADDASIERPGPLTRRVNRVYGRVLARLLRRPVWLLAGLLPLLGLGVVAYFHTGSGFMPAMDEGGFILDYRAAPGTALSDTDALLRQVEAILQDTPEVAHYSRRTGVQLGGGLTEANEGDFFVRLKPPPRRSTDAVMDAVRSRIEAGVPGLDIEMAQLIGDLIGDLTAVPQPVEVKLDIDDLDRQKAVAREVAAALAQIPGIVDVRDGIRPAGDSLVIDVNRDRAAIEGFSIEAVSAQVEALLSGSVSTQILQGIKTLGLRVWIPADARHSIEQLGQLRLRAPDGHLLPLARIAELHISRGEPQISRENMRRIVAVTARISGRDLGSVIRDVKATLQQPGTIPPDVSWRLGGLHAQQQAAFHDLIAVFGAAALLVFLTLLVLYDRPLLAAIIMVAPLAAAGAVFIGLWLTGIELNISALMGMTMVLGIVTEVSVFYFSELLRIDPDGRAPAALLRAGRLRLRPIAMTTLAAILALLPLALALGQGAQMQQPLAVAILSGLIVQLPLVLWLLPALYALTQKRRAA